MQTRLRAELLSVLLWVILYFSSTAGLPRVFVKEEEARTAGALRLYSRPSAVYTGKLLFNLLLLEVVALVLVPLFVLWFDPKVNNWPMFLAVLCGGSAALAGGATLLGALVARARMGAYLMSILAFGPLLPFLVLAINGTAGAIKGSAGNILVPILSYVVILVILSGALFERVWEE